MKRRANAPTQLARLEQLLLEHAIPRGMISRSDAGRLRERHIDDSMRATVAFEEGDRLAYDLGSGAGLPGLVLAIARPEVGFVLAESRAARAAFLELAIERLGIENARVHAGRAEDLPPGADLATARAFAPLERAWELAAPLLRPGGRLVYFAGGGEEALTAARAAPGPPREATTILASGRPLVIMVRT